MGKHVKTLLGTMTFLGFLLSGFASMVADDGRLPIVRGVVKPPELLVDKEVSSLTVNVPGTRTLRLEPGSETLFFADILDSWNLSSTWSYSLKNQVLQLMFDSLPRDAPSGLVRQVFVGNFFPDGSPLDFRVALFALDKPDNPDFPYLLVITNNAKSQSENGKMRYQKVDATLDGPKNFIFEQARVNLDGKVVNTKNFGIVPPANIGAEGLMAEFGRIRYVMGIVQDESLVNDAQVSDLLKNLPQTQDWPVIHMTAFLISFRQAVFSGNVDGAQLAVENLRELAKISPSLLGVEEVESRFQVLLDLWRDLRERGDDQRLKYQKT